ncbi:glutamate receptor 1-like [Penaeus monodon]|uniref:glutamate receptor 1-like n=1 Tax=Penaeus monodon TaxID=6687 RepID=UPI0018A79B35|nr:glutamate receptor 1-like [Penaeus monodon]
MDRSTWELLILKQLVRDSWSFTAVLGPSKNTDVGFPGNRTAEDLAKCQGLRVMRFLSLGNLMLLKEILLNGEAKMKWLLISDDESVKIMTSLYLPLDNKITIACVENRSVALTERHQLTHQHGQRVTTVGYWYADEGDPTGCTHLHGRESGHRKKINPRFPSQYEPLIILKHQADGTVLIDGVMGKVFTTLQEIANFTSACYRVKDGQWGAVVDGEWTGMLREVKDRRVDIAVGPLGITLKRTAIVDFLIGIVNSDFRIALRRPSNEDYMWTVYTKQFDLSVWLVLIFLTAGLVLCLYVVSRGFSRRATISFSDCALTIFGFLCGQGEPRGKKWKKKINKK